MQDDQFSSMRKVFDNIDKDKSGTIDKKELKLAMQKSGSTNQITKDQVNKLISEIDFQNN